ncbi:MAG: hypothetical protein AB7S39_19865, partial [Gemmatimonadales bacterium]
APVVRHGPFNHLLMPPIADFLCVWDTAFDLTTGDDTKTIRASLPPDVHIESKGVVAFMAAATSRAVLEVLVNGARRGPTYRIDAGSTRGYWEIMSAGSIQPGYGTEVTFRLLDSDGTISVSDVILWFKRQPAADGAS